MAQSHSDIRLLFRLAAWTRRPVIFRRAYLHVWCVGCTAAELQDVSQLDSAHLVRLAKLCRMLARSQCAVASVRLYCVGTARPDKPFSSVIPRFGCGAPVVGAWSGESRCGIVRMVEGISVRSVLLHEAAHAVFEMCTPRFCYPVALTEGYVELAVHLATHARNPITSTREQAVPAAPSHPSGKQSMSIAALLRAYDSADLDAASHATLARHGLCFLRYLGTLGAGTGDLVRRMLPELRGAAAATPDRIIQWLVTASGLTLQALDSGFAAFCAGLTEQTSGTLDDADDG